VETAGQLRTNFIGNDLARDTSGKSKNSAPIVSGSDAKVLTINSKGVGRFTSDSEVFVILA
jgi:hypothetical protein